MAIVKKVIGKVPIGRGNYSSTTAYYSENTVTMYGMSFRALTNISTGVAPAVADATGKVTLINTDKWQLMSGTPDGWNITAEVKDIKDRVIPEAVAEGIAEVVANAPSSFDTLKEVADYIASDKTKASQIETAISDLKKADTQLTNSINANATNIAKNASNITANTEALAKQAEELATKAPKVGYAPDLKVDFAKELVGRGVAEPQEIGTIRPTGVISIGDGNATIEKVKGKSVVWNQLVDKTRYRLLNSTLIDNTITRSGNGWFEISYRGLNDAAISEDFVYGHKYLLSVRLITADIGEIRFGVLNRNGSGRFPMYKIYKGTGRIAIDVFTEAWTANADYGAPRLGSLDPNLTSITIDNVVTHDLTQMFGAGNEPTTIEEFEARKPLGVSDDYNEGEIISYDAKELKSVGFNAFNGTYAKVIGGQQYHALGTITSIGFTTELGGETTEVALDSEDMFTPSEDGYVYAEGTDICIHLTHTYTPEHATEYEEDVLQLPNIKDIKDKDGNQLFPYGLLSAGRVHDEISATKAVKRIGVVDLGKAGWYINQQGPRFTASIPTMKNIGNWNKIGFLNATKYNIGEVGGPNLEGNIGVFINNVYVQDNTFTSAIDFSESLLGIPFYYELAEPIEVDLPEPLNLTYNAWDFGTEELIAEGNTTPLNADIVYQFNAVDRIRENTAKNQVLEAELAELKAQLTQLTQVTNEQDSNT